MEERGSKDGITRREKREREIPWGTREGGGGMEDNTHEAYVCRAEQDTQQQQFKHNVLIKHNYST